MRKPIVGDPPRTKKFDGLIYALMRWSKYSKKSDAEAHAKRVRKGGLARVVKLYGQWYVYGRP